MDGNKFEIVTSLESVSIPLQWKGKVGRKYVSQDSTLQAEHLDTSFVKIDR